MNVVMLLVLATLAVWRVTLIITTDEGPFSLFQKARNRVGPGQGSWVGRGIRCEMCVSFWLSLLCIYIFYRLGYLEKDYPLLALYWLALAGAVLFVDSIARK